MKIILTGGGTGGHFYPIIAVIEALRDLEREQNLIDIELHYVGDMPFQTTFFADNQVSFKRIQTGKRRQYFSFKNISDFFVTIFAFWNAFWYVYRIFPDVVFAKGGSVSFPVLLSAKFFGIPIMIHESDSSPGRTNLWASKFAQSIAISYPEAAEHFPEEKTVLTGNPLRKEVLKPIPEGAKDFLNLEENIPTIFILGGSQGAKKINDALLGELPSLLEHYQIIHQVGEKNVAHIESVLYAIFTNSDHQGRYKYFGHLDDLAMKMSAGAADLVISRAGSTIFEIAVWGIPSIIIPIRLSNGDHQAKNAYHYARSGAAIVVEEDNLTPKLLKAEIDRLLSDPQKMEEMVAAAKNFGDTKSAQKIAGKLLALGSHIKNEKSGNPPK